VEHGEEQVCEVEVAQEVRAGHVGEGSEVAAGPAASLLRHHRMDTPVEHLEQGLDEQGPTAARPLGQRIGPQQHHGPDDAVR